MKKSDKWLMIGITVAFLLIIIMGAGRSNISSFSDTPSSIITASF